MEEHIHHNTTIINTAPAIQTETWQIGQEELVEINGHYVVMAEGTHNGETVVFIDTDRDGIYDIVVEDTNHDGEVQDNEYYQIADQGFSVNNTSLLLTPVSNTWEIASEEIAEIDGQEVIVGRGTYQGRPAIFIDADKDGVYDILGSDFNGNGEAEDNELINITHQNIRVQSFEVDPQPTPVVHTETGVEVYGNESIQMVQGEKVIVGQGAIHGKSAVFMDVDHDGVYDIAFVDENGNGDLDDRDSAIDLSGSNIHVRDLSLIQELNTWGVVYEEDVDYAPDLTTEEEDNGTMQDDMDNGNFNPDANDTLDTTGMDTTIEDDPSYGIC